MRLKSETLLSFFVCVIFFFVSLVVLSYYDGGDQSHYRAFYEGVQGRPLIEAFRFYQDSLGSSEPGYFIFVYLLSEFIPKDLVFSFVNAALVFVLLRFLLAAKVSYLVLLLLSMNFYLLVLLFSAERLKLSLFFFMVALLNFGVKRYIWMLLSVFTHVQALVLCFSFQAERAIRVVSSLFLGRVGVEFIFLSAALLGFAAVFYLLSDHIISKLTYYYVEWGGVAGVVKPLIFLILSLVYADKKSEALLAGGLVVVLSFFLGGERLTIFSYFIFMYYALNFNRGLNFPVIVVSLYFFVKGIIFIYNVFEFGDGFGVPVIL